MELISFLDTATPPTDAMRAAMATATAGDDLVEGDTTVATLESVVAGLLGKEGGLLLPSGTMANVVAISAQSSQADELLADSEAHVLRAEGGNASAVAGVMTTGVEGLQENGGAARLRARLESRSARGARAALVCVENTHNRAGGRVVLPTTMAEIRGVCAEHGLALHVDGARLFNAAVALGVSPAELAVGADSVAVSLDKGLGAPVGALLVGSAELVERARSVRNMLGGGMRKPGVIAAAGLIAVREGVQGLMSDHETALALAELLASARGLELDDGWPQTNIVHVSTRPSGLRADQVARGLLAKGIRVGTRPVWSLRLVTHRGIGHQEVHRVVEVIEEVLGEEARTRSGMGE